MKTTRQIVVSDGVTITATQDHNLGVAFCFTGPDVTPPDVVDSDVQDLCWIDQADLPAFIAMVRGFAK